MAVVPAGDRLLFMIRHPSADVKGVYVARRDGGASRRVMDSDFGAQSPPGTCSR